MTPERPVPDVLAPGLEVVFVGINPGLASARARHHFANPANGFWRLLHEAGFTPRRLAPHEDRLLLRFGLGLTNLVSRPSGGVSDLGRDELRRGAEALGRSIARLAPRAVVFVGVTAWAAFAACFALKGRRCGEQPGRFAGARLFVLPNPSGRNAHFSRAEMLVLYRRAARRLGRGGSPTPPGVRRYSHMLRKRLLDEPPPSAAARGSIDVAAVAEVRMSSEAAEHPIDCAFDGRGGPGGTRWMASGSGEQTLVLAFDAPQRLRKIVLEVEELEVARTQELQLALSGDGGKSYREVVRQEFNFSPPGTSFEREEWTPPGEPVTHLRLVIKPDKGGRPCRASLTTLALD